MSQQFHLDRFEECFIHHMARKLVGKAGFTDSDLDDIKQDLRADVLQRLGRFDPARSRRHGFVVMRVRRCAATILERRRAAKRNGGRAPVSLNAPVHDEEDGTVELHELLDARLGRPGRGEEELRDLAMEVRAVVARLEPDLRDWCAAFGVLGIRGAARARHVPRCRLQGIARRIRQAFAAAALDDCLHEK